MRKLMFGVFFLFLSQSPLNAAEKILLESDSERRDKPVLYLPDDFSKRAQLPLVIALHGYKGSDRVIRFQLGLNRLVDSMGFMLLAPNGTTNSNQLRFWNASNFCCDFDQTGVDDVAFIKGLIDTIKDHPDLGHLDDSKIIVMGFSNGGFMANKLACELNDYIDGFVGISGTSDRLPLNQSACAHNIAIPMVYIHGLLDATTPFDGTPENANTPGHSGAMEFVSSWAMQNRCHPSPQEIGTANAVRMQGRKDSTKFVWDNCAAPVSFYQVTEGEHFSLYRRAFTKKLLQSFF